MRVVLQRVAWAEVRAGHETLGAIGAGLVALVGVAGGDRPDDARALADKTARLRLFAAGERPFQRAVTDLDAPALLCVSQFTLLGDVRRGNRPSWSGAAAPEVAAPLVEAYADAVAGHGVRVERGRFGAAMSLRLENDGPVTLTLDSADLARPRRGGQ